MEHTKQAAEYAAAVKNIRELVEYVARDVDDTQETLLRIALGMLERLGQTSAKQRIVELEHYACVRGLSTEWLAGKWRSGLLPALVIGGELWVSSDTCDARLVQLAADGYRPPRKPRDKAPEAQAERPPIRLNAEPLFAALRECVPGADNGGPMVRRESAGIMTIGVAADEMLTQAGSEILGDT